MIDYNEILKTGTITKESRSKLNNETLVISKNAKKRELIRNEWIESSKKLIAEGCNIDTVFSGLSLLLKNLDSNSTSAESQSNFKVAFSPGKDCKNLIIDHLVCSKNSLDICIFTISDNDIADSIIRLHKNGLKIRVIADNEKAEDEGSDIMRIADSGIPVKIDFSGNHMHHKFSISDNKEVLTGSYNWTKSAALYNQENLIVIQNTNVIDNYSKEFEKLWNGLVNF